MKRTAAAWVPLSLEHRESFLPVGGGDRLILLQQPRNSRTARLIPGFNADALILLTSRRRLISQFSISGTRASIIPCSLRCHEFLPEFKIALQGGEGRNFLVPRALVRYPWECC